jgi:superoxide dismutase, Fe-Mn family
MAFELPPLPYDKSALEPHISAKTLEFHHGKHHQAYVNKTNELIAGTDMEKMSLEEVIMKAAKNEPKKGLFNNAAQVWNHTFYWNCMKPSGGGNPSGKLADKIKADFGSFDAFKDEFKAMAVGRFGSGWTWLVLDKSGNLKITNTVNADLPMAHGETALLTVDVWEHAYYLDYQNRRPDYVTTFFEKLINWQYVAQNFESASTAKAA